ncbi:hypothetical protein A8C22_27735 [Klebsiella pneumoniae]|uniref:Uncharacterized protein n=1 Tax=Escherichia coli TaxID=562 RepID=A0A346FVR5_ECOLX|nr:hypothetical protein [Escherichia coli]EIW9193032.1 hypothetical protein [Klebsiella pneumoniae]KAB7964139.1 hypothetical protein GCL04_17495 [Klebsiella pneumoniae]MBM5738288.1 hypothetical protein [Klebsiella pneumoniae]MBM5748695.1 hypothetical protein [Klebsiella pneumoniae]
MSIRFCDARQGGGAYGKTAAPRPFLFLAFTAYVSAFLRVPVTPAAAERQERQRPSERGGVISPAQPLSVLRPAAACHTCHI